MEESEIQHIQRNKDSLMKTTICNWQFLAILESAGHLAKVDVQDIKAEQTDPVSSFRFYELIQTRAGGYQDLIKALENTNQTGAVNILRGLYDKNIEPSDNQYVRSLKRKTDGELTRRGLLQKIAINEENYADSKWNKVGNIARNTKAGAVFNNWFGSNCTHVTNQLDREILAVTSSEGDIGNASITGDKLVFDLTQLNHAHQRILPNNKCRLKRSNNSDFLKIYLIEADRLMFCGQKEISANVSCVVHYTIE